MSVPLPRRLTAATGPAFVVLVLAGNSLTGTAVPERTGSVAGDALAGLEAQAGSGATHAGVALELLAFVSMAVFTAHLVDLLRRRGALGTSGVLAAVAACWLLGVKVASGAPYLAGLALHDELTPEAALGLVGSNDASFVLAWLPFGLFVMATARSLYVAGLVGRVTWMLGSAVGAAGVGLALWGAPNPGDANPLGFLAGLLWLLVVGSRLALSEGDRGRVRAPVSAAV